MKKVIIILSILLFGCITKKETYLIMVEQDQAYIEPHHGKVTIYENRFEKSFNYADSIFWAKLREASKQASIEASLKIKTTRSWKQHN